MIMLQNDQIVTMYQLLATAKPEDRLDLAAPATHDATGVAVGICGDAARDFHAVWCQYADRLAAFEAPKRSGNAGRQQAFAAVQRAQRTGIDIDRTRRPERACDPLLARRQR